MREDSEGDSEGESDEVNSSVRRSNDHGAGSEHLVKIPWTDSEQTVNRQ